MRDNSRLKALAASPKTFAERDNWMRAILASDLPDAAVRVAIRIALHLHVNTGRCDPSYIALATDSNVSERSVYRLIALLEHTGWMALQRTRGRGNCNQYVLLNPAIAVAGFKPAEPAKPAKALSGFEPVKPAKTLSGFEPVKPANMVAVKKRSKRAKKEREGESDSQPLFASPDSDPTDAPNSEQPKRLAEEARKQKNKIDIEAEFTEFWKIYPRKKAPEAARKAFAAAIKRGADPAALIAGAKRYVAERDAAEPTDEMKRVKYTSYPATWLNGGGWLDEPPPGEGPPIIDNATGEEIAAPVQRPRTLTPWQRTVAEYLDEIGEEAAHAKIN